MDSKLRIKIVVPAVVLFIISLILLNQDFARSNFISAVLILSVVFAAVMSLIIKKSVLEPIKILCGISPVKDVKTTVPELSGEFKIVYKNISALADQSKNSALKFQSLLNSVIVPVIILDKETTISFINRQAAKILGYTPDELIDKMKIKEVFGTDRASRSTLEGKPLVNYKADGFDRHKKPMSIMITTAVIKNSNGEGVGVIIYILDLNEEQLKQKEMVRQQAHSLASALKMMAAGDLTAEVELDEKSDLYELSLDLDNSIKELHNAMLHVNEVSTSVANASIQISSASGEMASGAHEQSAQITEIAGAVEEMAKTIIETTGNINTVAESSKTASDSAKKGASKIQETKRGMEKIVSSAEQTGVIISSLANKTDQIGEITRVIDEIADQTNLLALNAAIEAARAGEQGRGFAVVADEVRKLAERTTKATKEIAETIRTIQQEAKEADISMAEAGESVKSGMKLTEEVSVTLDEILEVNEKVSSLVNQVAAASEEQSATAEEISRNIESISSVTQESAAGTEQIARTAEDLNQLTNNMQSLVAKFKLKQGKPLNTDNGRKYLR